MTFLYIDTGWGGETVTEAILHGIILAFGLIIPLGVQNVFVFNQGALQPKFSRALPVVITAGSMRHDTHCRGGIRRITTRSDVCLVGEYYFQRWNCFSALYGVCFMEDDCFVD